MSAQFFTQVALLPQPCAQWAWMDAQLDAQSAALGVSSPVEADAGPTTPKQSVPRVSAAATKDKRIECVMSGTP